VDSLTGDGAANVLTGKGGRDVLIGLGAADRLRIRDGLRDNAQCGAGLDAVEADPPGVDAIAPDCESLLP
jgi:hypothetical protein